MGENDIQAIVAITKLIGVLGFFIILIIFRKPITSLLLRGKILFKKGDTEVAVDSGKIDPNIQTISNEQAAPTIEKETNEGSSGVKDDTNDYFMKMFNAYRDRDKELLDKAYEEVENSDLNGNEKAKYRISYHRMRYDLGDTGALAKIEDLAEKYKTERDIYLLALKHLALCHIEANQYEKAFDIYEIALKNAKDAIEKANIITSSASCALELNENSKAINIMLSALNKETNREALLIYYKELAKIYEKLKETDLRIFALEKALQLSANNEDLTFNTAYDYSNEGTFKDLTLLHYKNLLKINPKNEMAVNNIGVAYADFELHGLKIDAYKKSMDGGNTLASANLSYEYMGNGFHEEAKKILKEASSKDDVHINVSKAITKLNEKIKSEEEKEKEILDKASTKQRFIRKYADAFFTIIEKVNITNSSWEHRGNILEIHQSSNEIKGTWIESSTDYMFEGEINNRAIKATVSRDQYDYTTKTKIYKEYAKAYIYISPDGDTLNMLIIENEKKVSSIKEFRKVTKTAI